MDCVPKTSPVAGYSTYYDLFPRNDISYDILKAGKNSYSKVNTGETR